MYIFLTLLSSMGQWGRGGVIKSLSTSNKPFEINCTICLPRETLQFCRVPFSKGTKHVKHINTWLIYSKRVSKQQTFYSLSGTLRRHKHKAIAYFWGELAIQGSLHLRQRPDIFIVCFLSCTQFSHFSIFLNDNESQNSF